MNKFYGPVSVGVALCLSTAVLAQEQPNRTPGTQSPSTSMPRESTRGADGDQVLVTWLLVDNENEIELSRLAVTRAQAPEVKQFAQKMIDDHTQFVQKLQQHAGKTATGMDTTDRTGRDPRAGNPTAGGTGNQGTGNAGTGNPGSGTGAVGQGNTGRDPKGEFPARTGTAQDASASRTGAAGSTFDHERLLRDLGKQCLASHTKMLQEKQGAEFDRCYMTMAVGAHVKAVDMLEVFRNHASPGLRPTLDEGLRTVQMHLQHAKDLAKRTDQMTNTTGK
jgi:predicted outer membrane protein